ncbi:TATA box-binding protein-associated factor RNA polymerase I subunit C [Hyperolius riggenbachi]|uniref:TATA box-binding protein-associated factor RNA polymerase I subunit C n=1 Tax=Hyperolius riggenbachi TaxID=752182 RepID=UPI0035A2C98F
MKQALFYAGSSLANGKRGSQASTPTHLSQQPAEVMRGERPCAFVLQTGTVSQKRVLHSPSPQTADNNAVQIRSCWSNQLEEMEFPHSQFPAYHHEGPVFEESQCFASAPGCGEHGRVQEDVVDVQERRFVPLYSRSGERWRLCHPTPLPLLPPNTDFGFSPVTESDLVYNKMRNQRHSNPGNAGVTFNFSQQVGGFCWDHSAEAFQCMGRLLEPHCYLGKARQKPKKRETSSRLIRMLRRLRNTPYYDCPFTSTGYPVRSLSYLTGDWLPDVPPALLGEMVNEGMESDWRQLQFQDCVTGGALSWAPYPGGSTGCLIYPGGAAMNQLCFQQMTMDESSMKLRGKAAVFELQQRVQQVSTAEFDEHIVAVRSMYNVASWRFSPSAPPRALSVVQTNTPSTCVNVSPHISGELCLCTEGGALYLWNLHTGLQRIRQDEETLYFRDNPHWRWSDFTSHPRVLLYADRTGVQAADTRVAGAPGLDLFRIGQESSCQRGERVILARCMRETDPAHFLVTTQFSVYVMDERFPVVPLVKWAHLMEGPPTFVSVVPGGGSERTNKILLGTHRSQEVVLLQYSGGDSRPCQLHLPPMKLPQISQSLNHLDPLPPHQHEVVTQRLASPMAGLAAAYFKHTPDFMTVCQLTEAGDVFTQRLLHKCSPSPSSRCQAHPSPSTEDMEPNTSAPEEASGDTSSGESDSDGDTRTGTSSCCEEPSENELLSINQTNPTNPIEVGADEETSRVTSLSPGAKHAFSRWICSLLKVCKRRIKVCKRPGSAIYNLFSSMEFDETVKQVDGIRNRLQDSMRKGGLIRLDAPQVPERVELVRTDVFNDPLSRRLTEAWKGHLELWWDDHFGLNKAGKIQALREKRRRQKLQRSQSRSSLSSFTSSFSAASDFYESEAASPWFSDGVPIQDTGASASSAVGETQTSIVSGQESTWSVHSASYTSPVLSRAEQTYPQPSSASPVPTSNGSKLPDPSSNIASSQSLRSKGIPKERRRTLQDFLTFLKQDSDPQHSSSTPPPSQVSQLRTSSRVSRTLSQAQPSSQVSRTLSQAQPSSQVSRTLSQAQPSSQVSLTLSQAQASSRVSRTLSQGSPVRNLSQDVQPHSSSQSLQESSQRSQLQSQSLHSETQTRSQRSGAKKFRMGF